MNNRNHVAGRDHRVWLDEDIESNPQIHCVAHRTPAATERDDAMSNGTWCHVLHDTVARRTILNLYWRRRKQRNVVNDVRISTLRRDDRAKTLGRPAAHDRVAHLCVRVLVTRRGTSEQQHLRAQRIRDDRKIVWRIATQKLDRLPNFQRVTAGVAEWTVHRSDERDDRTSAIGAELDHRLRKLDFAIELREERATSALDVQYETR